MSDYHDPVNIGNPTESILEFAELMNSFWNQGDCDKTRTIGMILKDGGRILPG